ncbi:hypothetical protein ACJMK2_039149 [Sinanodonta woodiana]|uniref:Epidermal growth factor-like protein 7 n=1 Tax=Sinanodonta woodiana TaxID=1069815 RepID=A0ABD3WEH8_SINWO
MRMGSLYKAYAVCLSYWICIVLAVTHVRPGRHVCMEERRMARPVPVQQSYCKPVYTPRTRTCPDYTVCPQYDVTYRTAMKTVFQMQISNDYFHACCPGWKRKTEWDRGCMEPICSNGCENGGTCTEPDSCVCPSGYSGTNCDADIDECESRDHGCTHMCKNTAGSYMCACQEGFSLATDGKTCTFCFTCQPELKNIQELLTNLQVKVEILEKDKKSLLETINNLETKYELALSMVDGLNTTITTVMDAIPAKETETITSSAQPTTTTETITTTKIGTSNDLEYTVYYNQIESLSEQIGMLEERLEMCTCKRDP